MIKLMSVNVKGLGNLEMYPFIRRDGAGPHKRELKKRGEDK